MALEKIRLKSIKLEWLNAECLLEVNRCVRYLKQHHGEQLKMQDPNVLVKLSKQVKQVNDPELSVAYKALKRKIVVCISDNPALNL